MRKTAVWVLLFAWIAGGRVLAATAGSVSVNAVGDIMTGTLFPERRLPPENGYSLFKYSAAALTNGLRDGEADIVMGNLEGAMTHHSESAKKVRPGFVYAFRMPPDHAAVLKEAGFNLLTAANNHSLDFGWKGYRDTRRHLADAGIRSVGDKGEILGMDLRGTRVAVVAFAYFDRGNNILDHENSMKLIRTAAASNDIVIVSLHAGAEGDKALHVRNEMETYLGEKRGNLVKFSRGAVDNGADLIIGHGPHVPRALELYNDRLIAYSLGNFATYGMSTQGYKKYTLVLRVLLDRDGRFADGDIVPMMQFDTGPTRGIPKPDPAALTTDLVRRLSAQDFPDNGIEIDPTGRIVRRSAPRKE